MYGSSLLFRVSVEPFLARHQSCYNEVRFGKRMEKALEFILCTLISS